MLTETNLVPINLLNPKNPACFMLSERFIRYSLCETDENSTKWALSESR